MCRQGITAAQPDVRDGATPGTSPQLSAGIKVVEGVRPPCLQGSEQGMSPSYLCEALLPALLPWITWEENKSDKGTAHHTFSTLAWWGQQLPIWVPLEREEGNASLRDGWLCGGDGDPHQTRLL